MTLFDHQLYHLHQERAKKTFQHHRFLFDHVSQELINRLEDFKKKFKNPLILSSHPLLISGQYDSILNNVTTHTDSNYDLVLSCFQAHWINDLPLYLRQISQCLQPEGLFVGALCGGQTLWELRHCLLQAELEIMGGASPRVAPFLRPSDAPALLQKMNYFLPVVDTETLRVTYSSLNSLMFDLRGMGETNNMVDRKKSFTPRAIFDRAEILYFEQFGLKDHKIPATFEIIYLTGWKETAPIP